MMDKSAGLEKERLEILDESAELENAELENDRLENGLILF